jgi:hypothetical protein
MHQVPLVYYCKPGYGRDLNALQGRMRWYSVNEGYALHSMTAALYTILVSLLIVSFLVCITLIIA